MAQYLMQCAVDVLGKRKLGKARFLSNLRQNFSQDLGQVVMVERVTLKFSSIDLRVIDISIVQAT